MLTCESRKRQIEAGDAKPPSHPPAKADIPAELLRRDRWVAWRWVRKQKRWTKVPINPHTLQPAKSNDPATWGSYEQAARGQAVRAADGVGFVFVAEDGLVGIDLDDCRDEQSGALTPEAEALVARLATYAEVSPTGTGIKLFALGALPPGTRNKGNGVELYAARRFFTVTGRLVGPYRTVEAVPPDVLAALTTPIELSLAPRAQSKPGEGREDVRVEDSPHSLGPSHVLPPQVKRPAPGWLLRLWTGDWSGRYPSRSEADLALVGGLAKYCDHDPTILDLWFRASGLMRPKWDERHAADGSTYGQVTVRAACANAHPAAELVTALAADIAAEPVDWLWPTFIPFGALTVLDGDPGLGKSTVTADLAACLTTGRPLPGGSALTPAAALLASCEDSAAHTLVPRLAAAGADPMKVRLLLEARDFTGGSRGLALPDDLALIERRLVEDGARLLVIDPLMAFLGRDRFGKAIDAHRDQSIRVLMAAFKALAERTGAAVVVVRHLNKAAGGAAVYRGSGSIGITGAARVVLLCAKHPDDPDGRVLAVLKSNLTARPPARAFRLTGTGPAVEWGPECSLTADDLLADRPAAAPRDEIGGWLTEALAAGPRSASELIEEASRLGWTERQVRIARDRLGVQSAKVAGGWQWRR